MMYVFHRVLALNLVKVILIMVVYIFMYLITQDIQSFNAPILWDIMIIIGLIV